MQILIVIKIYHFFYLVSIITYNITIFHNIYNHYENKYIILSEYHFDMSLLVICGVTDSSCISAEFWLNFNFMISPTLLTLRRTTSRSSRVWLADMQNLIRAAVSGTAGNPTTTAATPWSISLFII